MKAIIIDDEPLARSIVKEYLEPYSKIQLVQECNDGFEGLKAIMQHQPGLIFLDIQMPKINGFEMLELVEHPPAIIFTTAFDEYAIRAFDMHAVDYLLKPFSKERFDKAIQKLTDHKTAVYDPHALLETAAELAQPSQRIVVKVGGKIRIIPVDDVHYIEAADDYVKVHTSDGNFLKNRTMSYFERVLDKNQFVRIHRSHLLNVQLITRIDLHEKDNYLAILKTGVQVPISKTGYIRLKTVLGL